MNKFLKTILIILGVCALLYLALIIFATKKGVDQIDQIKKSTDKSAIYSYIGKINQCLLEKNLNGESDIPSFVTDKNFCTDEVTFLVEFENMENLELNIVKNENGSSKVSSAIITYNEVIYSYDGETDTITVK